MSEYIESGGIKGIELLNCTGEALPLAGLHVCRYQNENVVCDAAGDDFDLAAENGTGLTELADGEVMGLCNSTLNGLVDAGDCDLVSGNVQHNGNDRYAVFIDNDGEVGFDPDDAVSPDVLLDAFGDPATQPGGEIWADITYRRCNPTPCLATGAFAVDDYFNAGANGDVHDFGVAPAPVVCEPGNSVPVAVAAADQTDVTTGTLVTLDGTGSTDFNLGDVLSYAWTLEVPGGSRVRLDNAGTATPSFAPDVAGTYTATLIVNDGTVDSAPDSVVITATSN